MTRQLELAPPKTPTHVRKDKLGRSYTPEPIARAIVDRLENMGLLEDVRTVLEPCLGGGAFVEPFRGHPNRYRTIGIDLDPNAPGKSLVDTFFHGDCTEDRFDSLQVDLAITNPPFGRAVSQKVTLDICARSRAAAHLTVFLMPLEYASQVNWAPFMDELALFWPITGRVFPHERGMAVYGWLAGRHNLLPTLIPLRK